MGTRSAALLAAGLLVATAAGAASGGTAQAATPAVRPSPGMHTGPSCQNAIGFTANGRVMAGPLPAPVSRVGGDLLARPGLHVTSAAAGPPPGPKATAWLIADLDSGDVLAACNAHVPLAPASTLKVLTALTLLPKIDPARSYVARDEDARVDGTRVGLVPGSVYSPADLWHGLLMSSANDAATALASMAGGVGPATEEMTRTARSLGAADTRPLNTSGLDQPGQVTSVYDLALFGRAALADPALVTLMQTRSYAFPEAGTVLHGPGRKTFQIQNHNRLLYNYPGALGVKNGWTSTTGGSFIGAAARGGRRYLVTVLAADPETWEMSASLLNWAFATPAGPHPGVGRLVTGPDPDGALIAATTPSAVAGGPAPRVDATAASVAGGGRSDRSTVLMVVALMVLGAGGIGVTWYSVQRRRTALVGRADDPWQHRTNHWS